METKMTDRARMLEAIDRIDQARQAVAEISGLPTVTILDWVGDMMRPEGAVGMTIGELAHLCLNCGCCAEHGTGLVGAGVRHCRVNDGARNCDCGCKRTAEWCAKEMGMSNEQLVAELTTAYWRRT